MKSLEEEESEALDYLQGLVRRWPSKAVDPTPVHSRGRFVKAFPLDFPMGVADIYDERLLKVSEEEWVQHMLRYWTGHFVGGLRGQRVLWAMVNHLLLTEARRRGGAVYRTALRRVGLGLEGGGVLTKGGLREILAIEGKRRLLVNQLSTLGRDVRSTPMQWHYEGKKLDATVKHLSWLPPWVVAKSDGAALGEHWQASLFMGDSWHDVPDDVGLGRHPSIWYTLNCKYNAVFDVQRMNAKAAGRESSVLEEAHGLGKQERFLFARDNPDLVMYMLSLRTELHMRMVMPSVLWHSADWPFMSMARFETGANGNPHWHGFSMGLPGPRMERVRADVDGVGDEAPDTQSNDVRMLEHILVSLPGEELATEHQLQARVRELLANQDGPDPEDAVAPASGSGRSSSGDEPVGLEGIAGGAVDPLDVRARCSQWTPEARFR